MGRLVIRNVGSPIVWVRRIPRDAGALGVSADEALAMASMGAACAVDLSASVALELDSVPELSVTEEGNSVKTELTLTTRTAVEPDDLLLVGYDSDPMLLLGWDAVHPGRIERVTESSSPRREGPPVTYVHSSATAPLEVVRS